jgi:hypothetical protein
VKHVEQLHSPLERASGAFITAVMPPARFRRRTKRTNQCLLNRCKFPHNCDRARVVGAYLASIASATGTYAACTTCKFASAEQTSAERGHHTSRTNSVSVSATSASTTLFVSSRVSASCNGTTET